MTPAQSGELAAAGLKIFYISSRGVPTPVAHGHGMARMCEAYAHNGAHVELWRPYRLRKNFTNDVFGYYDMAPVFEVKTLGEELARRGPDAMKRIMHRSMTRTSVWGAAAAVAARRARPTFCHTRDPGLAFWLTRLGVPTVYEAHDLPWRAGRLFVRRLRHGSLLAAIGLTAYITSDLEKLGIPAARLHTIPNGVDLDDFDALPSAEECRKRLGLEQRPTVGYVGRFVLQAKEMEKGIPELIRAVAALRQSGVVGDVQLVCVGGPMGVTSEYLELADRVGLDRTAIRFVDRVSPKEVPYWIGAADVVSIPSPRTPFNEFLTSPLKLFEYMAAGAAIVATELPSVTPFLQDGRNALLVEPGDVSSLTDGLERVLRDTGLRARLGNTAREDSLRYSWKQRAARILTVAQQARN